MENILNNQNWMLEMLPRGKIAESMRVLTQKNMNKKGDELENILNNQDWLAVARKNQLPPKGDWNIWLLLAGRGFGKTRTAAETIRSWACSGKYKRIALIANTIQEAKQVMVEGESGLLAISHPSEKIEYYPSKRLIRWPNGAIATLYGAEKYEQLRGPQFDAAWVDEFAKFQYPKETLEQLAFSLRLGKHAKMIISTTPRPMAFLKELIERNDVVATRGTSLENINNLSSNFLKQLEFLKGTRLEAQEIYGEIVEDLDDTLWTWQDIEKCYKEPPHHLSKVIIGVDPALTSGANSDETGIIVVGQDAFKKGYVLEDLSGIYKPDAWAKKVIEAYHKYDACVVVIEANAGGELFENLIHSIDKNVVTRRVYAREGKRHRAEEIVLLYQKNLIFHAKKFHKLEMQMVSFKKRSKDSPDRLDAMVWAMHELFLKEPATPLYLWEIELKPIYK